MRTTVHCSEGLTIEFEADDHHASGFVFVVLLTCSGVALYMGYFGILKDGNVEVCGFFGSAVEPKTRGEFGRHDGEPDCCFPFGGLLS